MTIYKRGTADVQMLGENNVGKATSTAIYPGIQQCFAVAGARHDMILGAHVTPSTTEKDLDAIFDELKKLGGKNVMYWYVIGPFVDHFGVGTAQWRCEDDIKGTFKSHFPKNDSATHMILDCSAERHTTRAYDTWGDNGVVTQTMGEFVGIDIKVRVQGSTTAFSYKDKAPTVKNWTEFDLRKFCRF